MRVTKREFLEELRKRLSKLDDQDYEASVAYYEEMINDRIEDGLSEEEAVSDIGNISGVFRRCSEYEAAGKH